jgi:hypothetical protein
LLSLALLGKTATRLFSRTLEAYQRNTARTGFSLLRAVTRCPK